MTCYRFVSYRYGSYPSSTQTNCQQKLRVPSSPVPYIFGNQGSTYLIYWQLAAKGSKYIGFVGKSRLDVKIKGKTGAIFISVCNYNMAPKKRPLTPTPGQNGTLQVFFPIFGFAVVVIGYRSLRRIGGVWFGLFMPLILSTYEYLGWHAARWMGWMSV